MSADPNVEAVKARLEARSQRGLVKYGVTTAEAKLSRIEWLRHLQEELLDGAVYIEALLNPEGAFQESVDCVGIDTDPDTNVPQQAREGG